MCDWPSVVTSASHLFASAESHSIAQTLESAMPTQSLFQLICSNFRSKKYQKMMLNIDLARLSALHLSIHDEVSQHQYTQSFWFTFFFQGTYKLTGSLLDDAKT